MNKEKLNVGLNNSQTLRIIEPNDENKENFKTQEISLGKHGNSRNTFGTKAKVKTSELLKREATKALDSGNAYENAAKIIADKLLGKELSKLVNLAVEVASKKKEHQLITPDVLKGGVNTAVNRIFEKAEEALLHRKDFFVSDSVKPIQEAVFNALKKNTLEAIKKKDLPGVNKAAEGLVFDFMEKSIRALQDPFGTLKKPAKTFMGKVVSSLAASMVAYSAGVVNREYIMKNLPDLVLEVIEKGREHLGDSALPVLLAAVVFVLYMAWLLLGSFFEKRAPDLNYGLLNKVQQAN